MNHILGVTRGPTLPPYDLGVVAVVDGQTAKITPFRTANAPSANGTVRNRSQFEHYRYCRFEGQHVCSHPALSQGVDLYTFPRKESRLLGPKLVGRAVFTTEDANSVDDAALRINFSGDRSVDVLRVGNGSKLLSFDFDGPDPRARLLMIVPVSRRPLPHRMRKLLMESSVRTALDGCSRWWMIRKMTSRKDFPLCCHGLKSLNTMAVLWRSECQRMDTSSLALGSWPRTAPPFSSQPITLVFTTTNHLVKFVHLADPDGTFIAPHSGLTGC